MSKHIFIKAAVLLFFGIAEAQPPQQIIVKFTEQAAQDLKEDGALDALTGRWQEKFGVNFNLVRQFNDQTWIFKLHPPQPEAELTALLSKLMEEEGVENAEPDAVMRIAPSHSIN
ncbi:MAG: hypothetical protein MJA83_10790 [Gammaproteobacteria bacterium]|nr:hypothetical protein [Gammaproteobacteria bacterium]